MIKEVVLVAFRFVKFIGAYKKIEIAKIVYIRFKISYENELLNKNVFLHRVQVIASFSLFKKVCLDFLGLCFIY